MRKQGFHLKHGYAVLAIPDSGLFVKEGQIVTGHDTALKFDEIILFSRETDAQKHADKNQVYWNGADANGHKWNFKVVPVLVSERI